METAAAPFLSIVVPAYNEEQNLCDTVDLLLDKLAQTVPSFELLIVDDASLDATGQLADRLGARDARVRVFHHEKNRGIGGGFATAAHHARGEWLMLIPADLAIHLDDLHKYFEAAPGADIVVGIAMGRSDDNLFRKLVSWTNITAIRLLFGMRERQFQYISLYRTRLFEQIQIEYVRSAFFFAELLIKARRLGYRLVEVEVRYIPRRAGRATGARWRLIVRTARDMLHFWWRTRWQGK